MKPWKLALVALLLSAGLLWPGGAIATIAETFIIKCPLCKTSYAHVAITAWDSWTFPEGLPQSFAVCPHCLYGWLDKVPESLTEAQIAHAQKTIASLPRNLTPRLRQRLIEALTNGHDSDELEKYVSSLCAAQLRLTKVAPPRAPESRRLSAEDLKQQRWLRPLLPRFIQAAEHHQPIPWTHGSPHKHIPELYTLPSMMAAREREAATLFILWMLSADLEELEDKEYLLKEGLVALGRWSRTEWPDVDLTKARVPLAGDCLRYLRDRSALTPALQHALEGRGGRTRFALALSTCTACGDHSAAAAVGQLLRHSPNSIHEEAVEAYYEKVGLPSDLPDLEYFTTRCVWNPKSHDAWMYEAARRDVENAVRTIRLKQLLASDS